MKYLFKIICSEKLYSWVRWNYHTFSLIQAFKSLFTYFFKSNGLVKVQIVNSNSFIYIRPGTTDQDVYYEIFKNSELEYKFGNASIIVDGGAHIGCASIWFSLRYPESKIYAIEPDVNNYNVLISNSMLYPNIIPLKYGLWNKRTFLEVNDKKDNWSYTVFEVDYNSGLEAIGINELMNLFNIHSIDILKVDIEGSEVELFQDSGWIYKVDFLIVELHERFRKGCVKSFYSAIKKRNFIEEQIGEKIIIKFINN